MPLSDSELDVAVECAIHAALGGGSVLNTAVVEQRLSQERSSVFSDFVSQVEKHCEDEIALFLRAGTPSYSVLSRRDGRTAIPNSPTWIIDSIGGVANFSHGMPNISLSIALVVDKEAIVGIVNAPRLGEHFMAVKGRGAFCNGQRIHVSPTLSIQQAMILRSQSCKRTERSVRCTIAIHQELNFIPVQSILCQGTVALGMCFVAAGKADVYFEVGIGIWDFAAAAVIVREAGGVVHDVENTEFMQWARRGICCGNRVSLTHPVVNILKKHQYYNSVTD